MLSLLADFAQDIQPSAVYFPKGCHVCNHHAQALAGMMMGAIAGLALGVACRIRLHAQLYRCWRVQECKT